MKQQGRDRQEFTEGEICLPGAAFFGHNLSVRAEAPLGVHSHPHCMEVVLVVRGEQVYEAGNRTYTAAPERLSSRSRGNRTKTAAGIPLSANFTGSSWIPARRIFWGWPRLTGICCATLRPAAGSTFSRWGRKCCRRPSSATRL